MDTSKALVEEARDYVADPIFTDYDRTSMPNTLILRLADALSGALRDSQRLDKTVVAHLVAQMATDRPVNPEEFEPEVHLFLTYPELVEIVETAMEVAAEHLVRLIPLDDSPMPWPRMSKRTDTERLDWLEANKGCSKGGWAVILPSEGWALAIRPRGPFNSLRRAIDAAIDASTIDAVAENE